MRGMIPLCGVPVLAAGTLTAPAAYADGPPAADLRLVYQRPEVVTDHSGVVWHWTLTNKGSGGADTVIATQRVSAGQRITAVSKPCTAAASDVVCQFDSMRPGEQRSGWIKTQVPPSAGMLRVNAQVSWREHALREQPAVDAGTPEQAAQPYQTGLPAGQPDPAGLTGQAVQPADQPGPADRPAGQSAGRPGQADLQAGLAVEAGPAGQAGPAIQAGSAGRPGQAGPLADQPD